MIKLISQMKGEAITKTEGKYLLWNKSSNLTLGRLSIVAIYSCQWRDMVFHQIYDLPNALWYGQWRDEFQEFEIKKTLISPASRDMSASFPRSFCSATSKSLWRPVFACTHDEVCLYFACMKPWKLREKKKITNNLRK